MHNLLKLAKLSIAAATLLVAVPMAYADTLEPLTEGQEAFNRGDYAKALQLWQQLADSGQPEAQVFVGLAYANGWGVKKNLEEASNWYMRAAEKNNPSGQFLLGLHYVTTGVNQYDVRVGIKWLKRAADNGDKQAIQFLKKAKNRNWFTDLKGDSQIDRYKLEREGKKALESFSITANNMPNLPAPTL
ncbi:MAG: sel1 repeat family protein [Gammaproteobacteria bacterium]|nr:sel1 repeat family protein [Gammaproteobacteria bacterium]